LTVADKLVNYDHPICYQAPALDVDLYDDAVLRDSRDAFAQVRAAGPVVWLPRNRMFAIGRFADVRAPLHNDEVSRSGAGVAANPLSNRLGRDTTLFSDDELHRTRRNVLLRPSGRRHSPPSNSGSTSTRRG
jgi:cytochrome P450